MHKQIKFIYALLIITIIGGGVTLGVLNKENNIQEPQLILNLEKKYNNQWEGEWVTNDSDFYGGELTIINVTPTQFDFRVLTYNGANIGMIGSLEDKATAIIKGGIAVFKGEKIDDRDTCTLIFSLKKDTIEITDPDYICASVYGGLGVSFDGKYFRNGKFIETSLDNEENYPFFGKYSGSYDVFKKLVGPYIKNFESTAMQYDIQNGIDNELNGEIRVYWVSGLANFNTSIIIIAPGNKIWAAAPDIIYPSSEPTGNVDISYFTNVASWENKLPASIKEWINTSDHKNNKVIYRNIK
jgi:hypothetical protein